MSKKKEILFLIFFISLSGCASVVTTPQPKKLLTVDGFTGLGSTSVLRKEENATGAKILWEYVFDSKELPILLMVFPKINANGVSIPLQSEKDATVALVLKEKNGAQYEQRINLKAQERKIIGGRWQTFSLQNDSRDPNGRLDPQDIQDILIIDISAFLGKKGTNRLWVENVQIGDWSLNSVQPLETVLKPTILKESRPGPSQSCSVVMENSGDDPVKIANWNELKQKAIEQLYVANDWGEPQLVKGAVNSLGWEDSAFISADGNTLYFAYVPVDLLSWVLKSKAEGKDFSYYHKGPSRGMTTLEHFGSFGAQRNGDEFCVPQKFPYYQDGVNNASLMQAADGDWYYLIYDHAGRNIYRNGEKLSFNTHYDEDNPHFIANFYGRELYFESGNLPNGKGTSSIWVTREINGRWSEPTLLSEPINIVGKEQSQPFLTSSGELYFASDRDGKRSIWVSQRLGENAWALPQKILSPEGKAVALGEPTLTSDGQWMYFIVVFVNEKGEFDADVGRIQRKPVQ